MRRRTYGRDLWSYDRRRMPDGRFLRVPSRNSHVRITWHGGETGGSRTLDRAAWDSGARPRGLREWRLLQHVVRVRVGHGGDLLARARAAKFGVALGPDAREPG